MTETPHKAALAKRARRIWSPRALAIALVVPALGAAAILALQDAKPSGSRYSVIDREEQTNARNSDPLAAELARCRTVSADTVDERCRAAWELNRRRFFDSPSVAVPEGAAPAASLTPEER